MTSCQQHPIRTFSSLLFAAALCACGGSKKDPPPSGGNYVLASVVINEDGDRTTYVQTLRSLDDGPFNNKRALELPGNGVLMAHKEAFYVGLTEEPTWIKYKADAGGTIHELARLSLSNTGAHSIDYGNVIVDDETAVSVVAESAVAVIWNPKTMTISGEVDLAPLVRQGYELEVWTTVAHDGLVYIPGRWSDWDGGRIFPQVSITILDPKAQKVVATATDDRCASGGRVVFDAAGYGYVMGDGRNYSIQMFANASGGAAPQNCLLRLPPGGTAFDPDYYYAIPALTGGRESITELDTAQQGSGLGFAKMFYPDKLPPDVKPVDFKFWDVPAHKLWRLELADPPRAEEVQGIPFSTVGFSGSAIGGHLFTGESPDQKVSQVYETDPATNSARLRFTMDGYFDGLYELTK